jgi:dihydrofolate synthase / folylpolyglutamate synthase
LATVSWPGRLQLIERAGGRKILLDGAHNAAGARALRIALKQIYPGLQPTFIIGVLQDKNWQEFCQELAPLAARIFTVPVASERTADARPLADACRAANPQSKVQFCDSPRAALNQTVNDPFTVITGSLYLIGEAMELLGLSPAASERGLNEWNDAARIAAQSKTRG